MRKHSPIIYIFLIVTALSLIIPLLYVILLSFSGNGDKSIGNFTIENYVFIAQKYNFLKLYKNSLIVSISSLLLCITFSTMAAFALHKINFGFNKYITAIFFIGLLMPGQVLIVPVYQVIANIGLLDTRLGLILYYVGSGMPFAIFFIGAQVKSLPIQLLEAAKIEGASMFKVYRSIVLPYIKPAVVTLSIMNFIGYWNEMYYAMILLQNPDKKTLTAEMITLSKVFGNKFELLYAGLILAAVPIIIFYAFFHDKINYGENSGAVK
ncbi:MAG: carbohydrate ABC transporter permease [Anaerocolumna sp.]